MMSRQETQSTTYFRSALRRLKRDKGALAGVIIIVLIIASAVFAPFLTPFNPLKQNYDELLSPPSLRHPLGTDQYGRDVLTRILYGARYALLIGVSVVAIQLAVGVTLGLIAGYYGGVVESIIMRLTDVMLSIPSVVLAVTIAGFLGGGIQNVIIAVGAVGWREYTRLVRGQVLSAKEETFVEAARSVGCGDLRIMVYHIFPYTVGSVITYSTISVAVAILWAAALSFLGLGAQPPTPEWGAMLADGREFMMDAWWIATFPGLSIMFTVIGFNFFGDALRNALDPKMDKILRS
ncbi:MAG: ABC transporter permease [Desulfobacterota bacterium]|jgi:peptide/nickel transport system permease protein|nr:ABC transporter permease [Thermodesulfobacteriota bacterium]